MQYALSVCVRDQSNYYVSPFHSNSAAEKIMHTDNFSPLILNNNISLECQKKPQHQKNTKLCPDSTSFYRLSLEGRQAGSHKELCTAQTNFKSYCISGESLFAKWFGQYFWHHLFIIINTHLLNFVETQMCYGACFPHFSSFNPII